MSIIKTTVKRNDNTVRIRLPLKNNSNSYGEEQEKQSLMSSVADDLINPAIDGDVKIFKPKQEQRIYVNFFNVYYDDSYSMIDFDLNDIKSNIDYVINSFYFIDFFDTTNQLNQTRLFRVYVNKINTSGIQSALKATFPDSGDYVKSEFINWYIPNNLNNNGTLKVFAKFSFYNALNGNVISFRNNKTDGSIFFPCEINFIDRTWKFDESTFDIYQIVSETYNEKINDPVNNLDNLRQNLPQGSYFDDETISYRDS